MNFMIIPAMMKNHSSLKTRDHKMTKITKKYKIMPRITNGLPDRKRKK